jgi:methyl-accepting chemotaxis protein
MFVLKRAVNSVRLETLRAKILVFAVLPTAILLSVLITLEVRMLYREMRGSSLLKIDLGTMQAAAEIDRGNLEGITVARMMAAAQETGLLGRREESIRLARKVLETHPQFTGLSIGYEPNADGKDAESANTAKAGEASVCCPGGRFLPYWFRDRKNPSLLRLTPLIDMESSLYYRGLRNRFRGLPETEGIALPGGISSHYDALASRLSREEREYIITEPYDYEGKLIFEEISSIQIDGRFAGMVGVDRSLDETANFLRSVKPFSTADFVLISQRGRVISATMNPQLNTRRIEETPYLDVLLPFYRASENTDATLVRDPVDGRRYFYNAAKVRTGNWTIVMRVSEDEVFAPLWAPLLRTITVSVAGAALIVGILLWLSTSVARRVGAAAVLARRVAEGDLTAHIAAGGSDEAGRLLESIRSMVASLRAFVGQVKQSSGQVAATASRIGAASKSQEHMVSEFGSSTVEIAAAARQISCTAQELAGTMDEVASLAGDTSLLADSGRQSLTGMETAIRSLSQSSDAIESKLSVIREKAETISSVITTITKVADQTNLLSLNAAIEAEKAGKYGQGFSVVASEVRRLADQTAVATLNIERMVLDMQGAVGEGVAEMGRFAEQVRVGVAAAEHTGERLGNIIERIQSLNPRIEAVNSGMRAQSDGARQISTAMVHLKDAAGTTSRSVRELDQSAGELEETVRCLHEELARFQTGDEKPQPTDLDR